MVIKNSFFCIKYIDFLNGKVVLIDFNTGCIKFNYHTYYTTLILYTYIHTYIYFYCCIYIFVFIILFYCYYLFYLLWNLLPKLLFGICRFFVLFFLYSSKNFKNLILFSHVKYKHILEFPNFYTCGYMYISFNESDFINHYL